MTSQRLKVVSLCFLLLLLSYILVRAQLARAHAEYERAEPAADTVIAAAPAEVHIWFTQELFRREGANIIEVSGPDGTQVDQADTRLDDDDRKHTFVSLKPELPSGLYTVRWRNLSLEDGHEGNGEFSFSVGEAGSPGSPATAEPPATATPTALAPSPTPAPPAAPTSAPAGGLPCLGGLLLGGVSLAAIISGRYKGG